MFVNSLRPVSNGMSVSAIELVGPARRTTCTVLTNIAYSLGLVVLSVVVFLVRDWRQLALATSIPFMSFFLYWWWVKAYFVEDTKYTGRVLLGKPIVAYLVKKSSVYVTEISICLVHKHWPVCFGVCLSVFEIFRKIAKSDCWLRHICLSVRPPVLTPLCPHGITWFPLDGFSWIMMFENFSKICPENLSSIKISQDWLVLKHEHLCTFVTVSC